MQLEGKVALITGAAKRVGRAVALRLAQAGVQVAIHYNHSHEDAERTMSDCLACGSEAALFQCDLNALDTTAGLPQRVVERFGQLDILVNNASIFERTTIDTFDLEQWERHLRVNLTAPMVLVHAAREHLRNACGKVVNFCDVSTARPWPDHLAYMASKGGLDTLTKALARALAPKVNVTGVAPGVAAWPPGYNESTKERLVSRIPMNRAGSPEDMAEAVHYLLAAGDYVTGTILAVDGGRSIV